MSYQVLARKWRPGRFSELVGQEHVVSAISNALDNNRLHHAYLFTGTRGVGKTTIARIFSKSLNCEQGQSANPCGKCSTCVEIEQGNYVDLLEIDAASRTKVEDTREILDNVQYKPTRGDYKVYLIDEVHMLSKHSFNALLKTLEEPPPHVKFLLATTDPQKLPVTILSRCLQFNLKALSREQIGTQLEHILTLESVPFEPSAIGLLAKAAMGSMRDALSLTDQAIAQGNNQVTTAIVTDMLGLMDRQQLLKILFAITKRDASTVMAQVEDIAMLAPDYAMVLAELASLLHQIALTQWVPEACKLETNTAKAIYQLARHFAPEQVQVLYQTVLQGRKDLPLAIDGKSAFEMTLLRMMTFAPAAPIDDAETAISHIVPKDEPEIPSSAPPAPQVPLDSSSSQDIESLHSEAADLLDEAEDFRQQSAQSAPFQQSGPSALPPSALPPSAPPPELSAESHSGAQHEALQAPAQPPVTETPASSPVSSTSAMLALRQKLKKQTAEDKAEAGKKPPSEPSVEVPQLASLRSNGAPPPIDQQTPTAPPAKDVDAQVDSPTQESNTQEPPPWVLENTQAQPLKSDTEMSDAPHTSATCDAPTVNAASEAAPSRVDSQATEPTEAMESTALAGENNAVAPAQFNAYLDNGEKLTKASQIDAWSGLIEAMPVAGLLKQVALHSVFSRNGDEVTLTLDPSQQHLISDTTLSELSNALSEVLQSTITLKLTLDEVVNTPYQLQQQINTMRQQYARSVIQSDDTIQSIASAFNAQVVDDSITPR